MCKLIHCVKFRLTIATVWTHTKKAWYDCSTEFAKCFTCSSDVDSKASQVWPFRLPSLKWHRMRLQEHGSNAWLDYSVSYVHVEELMFAHCHSCIGQPGCILTQWCWHSSLYLPSSVYFSKFIESCFSNWRLLLTRPVQLNRMLTVQIRRQPALPVTQSSNHYHQEGMDVWL